MSYHFVNRVRSSSYLETRAKRSQKKGMIRICNEEEDKQDRFSSLPLDVLIEHILPRINNIVSVMRVSHFWSKLKIEHTRMMFLNAMVMRHMYYYISCFHHEKKMESHVYLVSFVDIAISHKIDGVEPFTFDQLNDYESKMMFEEFKHLALLANDCMNEKYQLIEIPYICKPFSTPLHGDMKVDDLYVIIDREEGGKGLDYIQLSKECTFLSSPLLMKEMRDIPKTYRVSNFSKFLSSPLRRKSFIGDSPKADENDTLANCVMAMNINLHDETLYDLIEQDYDWFYTLANHKSHSRMDKFRLIHSPLLTESLRGIKDENDRNHFVDNFFFNISRVSLTAYNSERNRRDRHWKKRIKILFYCVILFKN